MIQRHNEDLLPLAVDMSELSTYSEMFHARPHLQAAELAEYSVKISLLEEAKRSKEEEAESWHSKVRTPSAQRCCSLQRSERSPSRAHLLG